jgi:hypothetical protein
MAQYPHVRVFYGSDGLVHFMPFTDAIHNGQYAEKHIGQGLVDFTELDLSKYRLWLETAKGIPLTMEHYKEIRGAVYDVAETLKHRHSYAFFFLVGLLNNILKTPIYYQDDIETEQLKQLTICLEELERITQLQEVFQQAVELCLDRENRPDTIMSERLCEFMMGHPEFGDAAVKMQYALLPKKKGKVDIDTLRDIHDWKLTEREDLLEIMHQGAPGVSLMPYYLIEYLDEMLFFEFTEMLKNGQYVKRCKLCGQYFVLADKRKRDFCDRPYKGKRTCKQVGAKLFFEKGIEADAFLQQYLTEYNKVYSRRYRAAGKYAEEHSGRDLTEEQFKAWSAMASQARRDYVEGKISGEEMLARIRVSESEEIKAYDYEQGNVDGRVLNSQK